MKKNVFAMAALLSMAACTTKPMPAGEEKEYPEALFTFGELADVELEMPEETWQKIIKKASDKNYYECAVTINGEQFDDEDGLFKFEKRMT